MHFTSGLRYNDQQELYRPIYPGIPQYVGEPSAELDDAWENLLGRGLLTDDFSNTKLTVLTAVNIFVTPNEEPLLGGGLFFQPDSRLYMAQ